MAVAPGPSPSTAGTNHTRSPCTYASTIKYHPIKYDYPPIYNSTINIHTNKIKYKPSGNH